MLIALLQKGKHLISKLDISKVSNNLNNYIRPIPIIVTPNGQSATIKMSLEKTSTGLIVLAGIIGGTVTYFSAILHLKTSYGGSEILGTIGGANVTATKLDSWDQITITTTAYPNSKTNSLKCYLIGLY